MTPSSSSCTRKTWRADWLSFEITQLLVHLNSRLYTLVRLYIDSRSRTPCYTCSLPVPFPRCGAAHRGQLATMPTPTRLSIACIVGATLASLAVPACAHQPGRPRSHGAPGGPAPVPVAPAAVAAGLEGGGGAMLVDRGFTAGAQDEQALLFGAGAGGDTLYGDQDQLVENWTATAVPADGDAAVPHHHHHPHLNRRRPGVVHRRDSDTVFSDSIAREMKLLINPKWLAMNPKWTPSNETALGGVPAANSSTSASASIPVSASASSTKSAAATGSVSASASQNATRTSSAATSTTSSAVGPAESVAWVLPSPPSSTCASMYTDTSGGGVYAAQVGNVPWSPRPSTFVVRGGNKLYLDGDEFRIVGPSKSHLAQLPGSGSHGPVY